MASSGDLECVAAESAAFGGAIETCLLVGRSHIRRLRRPTVDNNFDSLHIAGRLCWLRRKQQRHSQHWQQQQDQTRQLRPRLLAGQLQEEGALLPAEEVHRPSRPCCLPTAPECRRVAMHAEPDPRLDLATLCQVECRTQQWYCLLRPYCDRSLLSQCGGAADASACLPWCRRASSIPWTPASTSRGVITALRARAPMGASP